MTGVSSTDRGAALGRFVQRFDRGEYWLAHEELEELWLSERVVGYKGLIHLAAALLHLQRGNRAGAATKLRTGLGYLVESPPQLQQLDLESVRAHFGVLLEQLERDEEPEGAERLRLADCYRAALDPAAHGVQLPYRVRRHDQGYRTGRDPRRRD